MDQLTITDAAAERISVIKKGESKDSLYLRISVEGGGCSGFKYIFTMEDQPHPEDYAFEHNGEKVITDKISLSLLNGSILDYVEDLSSAKFVIKNPNAATRCGCGNSFSIG